MRLLVIEDDPDLNRQLATALTDAGYVVGVRLAHDQITVAVTNFCADVLHSLSLPIRIDRQTAAVIADLVEDGVRRCIEDADLETFSQRRRVRTARERGSPALQSM